MIEFELKFRVEEIPSGLDALNCMNKISEVDNYFDTDDNCLIRNGNFFRLRNDKKIDFKLDIGDDFHLYCKETSFLKKNITSENMDFMNIFQYLGIHINTQFNSFDEFIEKNKFHLIAPICKERCIFRLGDNITITVDTVSGLGNFIEIEQLLNENIDLDNKLEIKSTLLQILKDKNIYEESFLELNVGYVELYLKENNSDIYELGKFKV